jgi:hypothetical protein
MQQKSKNRIRVILFLFGFILFASGLGFTLRGINPLGTVGLFLTAIGALCIVLAIYLAKEIIEFLFMK